MTHTRLSGVVKDQHFESETISVSEGAMVVNCIFTNCEWSVISQRATFVRCCFDGCGFPRTPTYEFNSYTVPSNK